MSVTWTPCAVRCVSDDGGGCGAVWVEWGLDIKSECPGCGRKADMRSILFGGEGMPRLARLEDPLALVVFFEEAE